MNNALICKYNFIFPRGLVKASSDAFWGSLPGVYAMKIQTRPNFGWTKFHQLLSSFIKYI